MCVSFAAEKEKGKNTVCARFYEMYVWIPSSFVERVGMWATGFSWRQQDGLVTGW